jgi:CRP-like cAMP-binding protein
MRFRHNRARLATPLHNGNGLLAALPPADFKLLAPHLKKISFEFNAVLVRSGDELKQVYFPLNGAIAFLVEMSDGLVVASTLMGSEGAVGALSILSPSRSPVTATAYVAGAALHVPVSQLKLASEQSAAIRHVLRLHLRTQLLQLQNVAACNAVHPVECRMARWLLESHDRIAESEIQLTQDALGGVDSKDSLLGANQIQDCIWGGSLGCDGSVGFERRGVGANGAADHRPA